MFSCTAASSLVLLAAQSSSSNSAAWAIVLGAVIFGLVVTLKSSRRTTDFKRPTDPYEA